MTDGDLYKGYKGRALEVLKSFRAQVWSDARITTSQGEFTGIVLPRSETADPLHVVIKLRSGIQRRHRGRRHHGPSRSSAGKRPTTRSRKRSSPTTR